jgi:hypothetical protein
MEAAAIDYIPFDPSILSNGGTERRCNQVAQPYLLNSVILAVFVLTSIVINSIGVVSDIALFA